jgi:hypothetical protein
MNAYPVLRSTLEGIFGAGAGLDDAEATQALRRDLAHPPFREAIKAEMSAALADPSMSWQQLLHDCEVAYFDSEEEAKNFVVERLCCDQ